MGDYIKLHRSITKWEWFQDANTLQVWLYCLVQANWKAGRFQGHEVPRGSFITSYAHMAADTGLSIQCVRTAINHLKTTKEITVKSTNRYTLITVEKYGTFQDDKRTANKQLTNNQQTTNKQLTTIEERKEGKKGRKKEITPPNPRGSIADRLTAAEWVELEKRLSNQDILNLIDEADAKGCEITHPYAYIMTMAQNQGLIKLWK